MGGLQRKVEFCLKEKMSSQKYRACYYHSLKIQVAWQAVLTLLLQYIWDPWSLTSMEKGLPGFLYPYRNNSQEIGLFRRMPVMVAPVHVKFFILEMSISFESFRTVCGTCHFQDCHLASNSLFGELLTRTRHTMCEMSEHLIYVLIHDSA